jgi:hypothetical protein
MNTIAEFFKLPAGVQIGVLVMLWPAIWAGMLITFALMRDVGRQDKGRMYDERDATVHSRMRKVS